MRFRIGYGGPRGYQHGYRRPSGNLSEFERLLHLIVSLQILFGSRRGGLIIPLLLVGIGFGGWYAYKYYTSPDNLLHSADQKWDSGDTMQRIDAIGDYKALLQKRDPLEPGLYLLKQGRERLYRRIVTHHVLYDVNDLDLNDWVRDAWDEGFRDLGITDERVKAKWDEITKGLRREVPGSMPERERAKDGPFDSIPGLDDKSGFWSGSEAPVFA